MCYFNSINSRCSLGARSQKGHRWGTIFNKCFNCFTLFGNKLAYKAFIIVIPFRQKFTKIITSLSQNINNHDLPCRCWNFELTD